MYNNVLTRTHFEQMIHDRHERFVNCFTTINGKGHAMGAIYKSREQSKISGDFISNSGCLKLAYRIRVIPKGIGKYER